MNDRLLLGVYALGGRVRDEATRRRALVPPLPCHPPSAEAFRGVLLHPWVFVHGGAGGVAGFNSSHMNNTK